VDAAAEIVGQPGTMLDNKGKAHHLVKIVQRSLGYRAKQLTASLTHLDKTRYLRLSYMLQYAYSVVSLRAECIKAIQGLLR
jgi:hypothetical protein